MSTVKSKVIGVNCLYNSTVAEIPFSEKAGVVAGDSVIFRDEEKREEFGVVSYVNHDSRDDEFFIADSKILRKATANDLQKMENLMAQSEHALEACKKYSQKHGLEMYPFNAGYSFDGSKIFFMFTADERVDFRELVKDLAKVLQKQIHLRQIGPRDKAKVVGGFGRCGRRLCCTSFLSKLESINMDMVRAQSLESKGSSKLSGSCGKLLCCLKYEVENYKELRGQLPEIGDRLKLKKSSNYSGQEASVIALDVLNQKLKVRTQENEIGTIDVQEVDKVLSVNKN